MAIGRVDRNPKWRFDDIVFMETCAECGVKVEWQSSDPVQNNQNNFRDHLYRVKGWALRSRGFLGMGGKEWVCELHK